MTNQIETTQAMDLLWTMPSLYVLSLGLFVPGILMASRPAVALSAPAANTPR